MRTVVITDIAWSSAAIERAVLGAAGATTVLAPTGVEDELLGLVPGAEAILTHLRRVSARVLDAAPRCRTVARYGADVGGIDLARATELGIVVTNVPVPASTAEGQHRAAANVAAVLRGELPATVVNRDVLEGPHPRFAPARS